MGWEAEEDIQLKPAYTVTIAIDKLNGPEGIDAELSVHGIVFSPFDRQPVRSED